jgi:hypothetical protein
VADIAHRFPPDGRRRDRLSVPIRLRRAKRSRYDTGSLAAAEHLDDSDADLDDSHADLDDTNADLDGGSCGPSRPEPTPGRRLTAPDECAPLRRQPGIPR